MGLAPAAFHQSSHAGPVSDSGEWKNAKHQEFETTAPLVSAGQCLRGPCHQWRNPAGAADRTTGIGRRAGLHGACGGFEFRTGGWGGSLAVAWLRSEHQTQRCLGSQRLAQARRPDGATTWDRTR